MTSTLIVKSFQKNQINQLSIKYFTLFYALSWYLLWDCTSNILLDIYGAHLFKSKPSITHHPPTTTKRKEKKKLVASPAKLVTIHPFTICSLLIVSFKSSLFFKHISRYLWFYQSIGTTAQHLPLPSDHSLQDP